ncbi:hypothetical protein BGZ61DRAFT_469179, partial [Ilyonectria robusta]|uniref:uncharacterized protein n=1 Tax=Ilyonectria robusta TaxID=1079257 RepID=UPI001E8D0A26
MKTSLIIALAIMCPVAVALIPVSFFFWRRRHSSQSDDTDEEQGGTSSETIVLSDANREPPGPISVAIIGSPIDAENWLETNKAQLTPDFHFDHIDESDIASDSDFKTLNQSGILAYVVFPSLSRGCIKNLSVSSKLKLVVGGIPSEWKCHLSFTDDWMEETKGVISQASIKRLQLRQKNAH